MQTEHMVASSLTLLITLSLVGGCSGCSGDLCERPDEAREIVSDEQIEQFQEAGVDFHCGDEPPTLTGTYEFRNGIVEYHDDEDIIGVSVCDSILTIEPTDNDYIYVLTSELTSCDGESTSINNYVSGEGDCFTLYQEQSGTFEGCETGDIGIFSGCLVEGGIEDPRGAGLATHREGDTCESLNQQGRIALEGQIDVIAQTTEFAARIDEEE